jgi:hypothetical protein
VSADLDALRAEASRSLGNSTPAMRSCWDCNAAHYHLRDTDFVIWCFCCGRYLYRGTNITTYDDAPPTACSDCGATFT